MRAWKGVVLIVALVVGLVAPAESARAHHPDTGSVAATFHFENAERARRGLSWMHLDHRISRYAEQHSQEMAQRGYIFHSSQSKLLQILQGTGWKIAGENVGVGGSARTLHNAFMASPPHRANILNPGFNHVAIGAFHDQRLWLTVIFYGT